MSGAVLGPGPTSRRRLPGPFDRDAREVDRGARGGHRARREADRRVAVLEVGRRRSPRVPLSGEIAQHVALGHQVVGAGSIVGPEVVADGGGAEVDEVLAPQEGGVDPVGARPGEDRLVEGTEQRDVGGPTRADGAEQRRVGVVDGGQPGEAPLDQLLVDQVGPGQRLLGSALGGVVDLHEQGRPAGHRGVVEGEAGERCDPGCSRGGRQGHGGHHVAIGVDLTEHPTVRRFARQHDGSTHRANRFDGDLRGRPPRGGRPGRRSRGGGGRGRGIRGRGRAPVLLSGPVGALLAAASTTGRGDHGQSQQRRQERQQWAATHGGQR